MKPTDPDLPARAAVPRTESPSSFGEVSSALVRAMLRYAGREGLGRETLLARCGEAAPRVAEELVARGYVEALGSNGRHRLTPHGRAWIHASTDATFHLATARRAISALLLRAEAISAGPNALFVPRRIALFGDILEAPPTLRRVDIGVHLVPGPRAEQLATRGALAASNKGGPGLTPEDWLALRERAVWAHLAGRSPVLRLFPLDASASAGRGVEIYPADEATALLGLSPKTKA